MTITKLRIIGRKENYNEVSEMDAMKEISNSTGLIISGSKPLHSREGYSYKLDTQKGSFMLKCVDKLSDRGERLEREAKLYKTTFQGETEKYKWFIREWKEGKTASSHFSYILKDRTQKAKKQFLLDSLKMIHALMKLHSNGYLHGDVQPNHFIFKKDHDVSLVDMETVVKIGSHETGYDGGLVHYASPEVAKEMLRNELNIPYSITSEIYSFGAVLFILYTDYTACYYVDDPSDNEDYLKVSFEEELQAVVEGKKRKFNQIQTDSFPELERILVKCLEKNPSIRYQNFEELQADLESLLHTFFSIETSTKP
jgi:serine/threonine protein kinase